VFLTKLPDVFLTKLPDVFLTKLVSTVYVRTTRSPHRNSEFIQKTRFTFAYFKRYELIATIAEVPGTRFLL
jgi:hypothetical protein